MPRNRLVLASVIASSTLLGCEAPPAPPSVFQEATDVVVAKPIAREVTDYEEFTGHTEAILSVEVKSMVTGYLVKRHFREGEEVKEGDLLYEIDDRPYKAELDRAEANVARYQALRRRLDADHNRSANLFRRGAIGRAEFDVVTSDYAEAGAMLGVAEAQLHKARLDIGYTKIRAPMSGQISRSLLEPGNLIHQESTILTDIVEADKLYVYFDLSQDILSRVQGLIRDGRIRSKGGKEVEVRVGLSDREDFSYQGTLNFSENKVDAATGTLRIRGVMDNPRPWILSPGLFVRVRLPIGDPHPTLLVPQDAVGSDQGRAFVYAVNDTDDVVYKPVEVGQTFDGMRSIAEGIDPTDRLIVAGLQRVRPGTKVSPKEAQPTKTAENSRQKAETR